MTLLLTLSLLAACAVDPTPIDFDTEIMPLLTRHGCNSGACHGSASGRGGFRLSLYGSRPSQDYESIVLELGHRRVNLAHPQRSLLLLKPTGQFDHGGDVRFAETSPAALRLLQWIRQGAVRQKTRQLTDLEVVTGEPVVARPGDTVSVRVRARFSDGTTRDVTRDVSFAVDDPAAVTVDETGRAVVHRRGRHVVIVRFLDQVRPLELFLPWDHPPAATATTHGVDAAINKRLHLLGIPAAPPCTDQEFLRRVTLDLTGCLPTALDVQTFPAVSAPNKRERLIDRLLESPEFVDVWTLRLVKQLRVPEIPDRQTAILFRQWIHSCVRDELGWDTVVSRLVTASGSVNEVGPAGFYFVGSDPRTQTEYLSEALLGIRIRCANCHDHPLDQWTQDDYHGLSAILAGVQRGRTLSFNPRGTVIHPGTGRPAVPRLPGERFLDAGADLRPDLAAWLTSDGNPQLARAFVNRVWAALMGRGLVEPVDDLRITNPPTHPELMDALAAQFARDGYRLRSLIRTICTSAAYQRSSRVSAHNVTDAQFYSHALQRPLLPEVLLDAVCTVTGVAEHGTDGLPVDRFVALPDPRAESSSLTVLGRCAIGAPCTTPEAMQGLTGALELINGRLLNDKLRDSTGRVHKLLRSGSTTRELIQEFFILALGRTPASKELSDWQQALDETSGRDDRDALVEDFVWSLLTSEEFRTNH